MDLDLGTTLSASVATLLLLPILWIRVQRSKQIQPKYKRGITMVSILVFILVVAFTREFTEYESYTEIFQLGTLLVCVLLSMVVARACWGKGKSKLALVIILLAAIIRVSLVHFARESTTGKKRQEPHNRIKPHYDRVGRPRPEPMVKMSISPHTMSQMSMPSGLVNHLNHGLTFNIRKTTTNAVILLFACLCVFLEI